MSDTTQIVALVISDAMVRKGLELLLADLNFSVISTSTITDLKQELSTAAVIPDLFLFSMMLENDEPAISTIRALRQLYNVTVPAILLSNDLALHELLFTDNKLTVLPESIKPSVLREKISQSIA